MRVEDIANFLLEANKVGYASEDSNKWKKELDGSTSIEYESGNWRFHDSFFGGEPYGGREVVFFKERAVWMMVYYGEVNERVIEIRLIYKFLQEALKNPDKILPVRGPRKFKKNDLTYTFSAVGNLKSFNGSEFIAKEADRIYKANFVGGLVNQRSED